MTHAVCTAIDAGGLEQHRVRPVLIGRRVKHVKGLWHLGRSTAIAEVPSEGSVGVGADVHQGGCERRACGLGRQKGGRHLGVNGVVDNGLRFATKGGRCGLDHFQNLGSKAVIVEHQRLWRVGHRAFTPIQGDHIGVHARIHEENCSSRTRGLCGDLELGHRSLPDQGQHCGVCLATVRRRHGKAQFHRFVDVRLSQKGPLECGTWHGVNAMDHPCDVMSKGIFVARRHQVGLKRCAGFQGTTRHGLHFGVNLNAHDVRV